MSTCDLVCFCIDAMSRQPWIIFARVFQKSSQISAWFSYCSWTLNLLICIPHQNSVVFPMYLCSFSPQEPIKRQVWLLAKHSGRATHRFLNFAAHRVRHVHIEDSYCLLSENKFHGARMFLPFSNNALLHKVICRTDIASCQKVCTLYILVPLKAGSRKKQGHLCVMGLVIYGKVNKKYLEYASGLFNISQIPRIGS